MAYDRDDIEKIRQSVNIVELMEAVTTVRKRGRSFKAICPFHQEKTPSVSLDPARGLFHCFGCGAGGDIFKFVMESQAMSFNEAVEYLAQRAGVTLRVDPAAARRRSERRRLTDAIEAAVVFYTERLKSGPDAGGARSYVRSRGYDAAVVEEFEIGYSPDSRGRNELVRALKDQGFSDGQMITAGLARRGRRGGVIDWFNGRLMFPIRDLSGDAVGFGARLLEGDGPKYLNTPETKLYHKASLLYGLDRAKAAITRTGYSIVVEGYTDVIALHRAGLPLAVASCGTALGEDHFDLLRRFSDRIVLAFDADQAGAGAAIRGDELHLPAELGLDLRVAVMPEGRDPADLVQDGDTALLTRAVEASVPLLQFRLEREVTAFPLEEPEGRSRAVAATAPMIARLSDHVMRVEYSRYVAKLTGTDATAVEQAVERARRSRGSARPQSAQATDPAPEEFPPPHTGQERAELDLLRLVAAQKTGTFPVTESLFTRPDYRAVLGVLESTPVDAIDDEGIRAFVRRLLLDDRPEADPEELYRRLDGWRLDRRIAEVRSAIERSDPEDRTYTTLMEELIALERIRRESESE